MRLSTGPCTGQIVQGRRHRLQLTTRSRGDGGGTEVIVNIMRILVALDGSRWAESALPKAVELVKQNNGARVVVVRAVDPATVDGDGTTEARMSAINDAADYLGDIAAQLREAGVRPVSRSVLYAAAGPAIVR